MTRYPRAEPEAEREDVGADVGAELSEEERDVGELSEEEEQGVVGSPLWSLGCQPRRRETRRRHRARA
jgi:hypothetical protein